MIKLGIIGYPLGHTLSPVMHKAALDYLGIEGDYAVLETPPEELINRIKYLKVQGFRGFNVTIPLKVWIVPLLNEVDEYANLAGAVNTVIISENKDLYGYNTDIDGFIESIPEDLKENLKSKKAAILGAGGAARAVAIGLSTIGINEITFYARNPEKANIIQDVILEGFPEIKVKIKEFNEFADLSYASIVVNTTPIGMQGINEGISPINKKTVEGLAENTIVYDLIYKPRETKLIQYAKEHGLYTLDGLEMLILQGAKALSLWIDQEAPVEVMREAVLKSLKSE
ncbi:MAG: shikimate dehydrogenase [Candidatus Melainabacteria bacterium RIFOXYA12_FULL_32_12]|nr:MAG: shikimate dehydrogenase [Candidatus Melainabacteria bacterium GWF2_32_7]OGI21039.1 MAG: shikimate dehydrogenase [Candidatus Melainabacteria bacterium RIFOXYA2_FULL_32_9]OGI31680.1 MAG: shikimate dehydrogenase [Candidatus Melainabacteria bacterium RIFOXYA12_FULL_32_12]